MWDGGDGAVHLFGVVRHEAEWLYAIHIIMRLDLVHEHISAESLQGSMTCRAIEMVRDTCNAPKRDL